MQTELLSQDFSDESRKTHRVRIKKKVRVRLNESKKQRDTKRFTLILIFGIFVVFFAAIGAIIYSVITGPEVETTPELQVKTEEVQ